MSVDEMLVELRSAHLSLSDVRDAVWERAGHSSKYLALDRAVSIVHAVFTEMRTATGVTRDITEVK